VVDYIDDILILNSEQSPETHTRCVRSQVACKNIFMERKIAGLASRSEFDTGLG